MRTFKNTMEKNSGKPRTGGATEQEPGHHALPPTYRTTAGTRLSRITICVTEKREKENMISEG